MKNLDKTYKEKVAKRHVTAIKLFSVPTTSLNGNMCLPLLEIFIYGFCCYYFLV
jgi:hypothetical protein